MMELKDILALRLRALMDVRPDLDTQTKIHKRIGMSQSTIQRVLARQVHTGLDVLAALAEAFGVQPTDLIAPIEDGKALPSMAPNAEEMSLLQQWRQLDDLEKQTVIGYIGLVVAKKQPWSGSGSRQVIINNDVPVPANMVAAVQRASSKPGSEVIERSLGKKSNGKKEGIAQSRRSRAS